VLAGSCRVADQPAATLLIPYFEVNLDDPAGATTLVSINNASSKAALARVVLWTDWGVPTLAFDLYLTGFDVQTLNVRDLFTGTLPRTGASVSPNGKLSVSASDFPGCGAAGGPQVVPLKSQPTVLAATDRQILRAAHTGKPVATGQTTTCLGSVRPGGLAVGYITVDTVNRCTPVSVGSTANTPADPKYFAARGTGLASDNNVLWGDVIFLDRKGGRVNSQTAVHIVADADAFGKGDYTFYGRYVDFEGRDDRAPLSSLYYARYMQGGAFGSTELVVWRDNRTKEAKGGDCAKGPSWEPLGGGEQQRLPGRHAEGEAGRPVDPGRQPVRLGDARPLARRRRARPGLGRRRHEQRPGPLQRRPGGPAGRRPVQFRAVKSL
jgi:hypothetical protein